MSIGLQKKFRRKQMKKFFNLTQIEAKLYSNVIPKSLVGVDLNKEKEKMDRRLSNRSALIVRPNIVDELFGEQAV